MGLLEDLNSGKYNLVIYIIIFGLFFHQYWTNNQNVKEHMGEVSVDIKEAIKQVYLADVEAIRNLAEVATKLQKEGLTIPGNLTVKGELRTESGNFYLGNKEKDQWIFHSPADDRGGLWISRVQRDGNVNWANGLNMLTSADGTQNVGGSFNLVPKGTVVSWTGTTAPAGWALCNGQNGTPNLQGRFIFGWNPAGGKHAKVPGADYNQLNGVGGNQIHQLTVGEMPAHAHPFDDAYYAEHWGPNKRWGNSLAGSNKGADGDNAVWTARWNTEPVGGNDVHNTMPPYYILAYIMKL